MERSSDRAHSLGNALLVWVNAKELTWNEYLFLPIDKNWFLDSVCSVINWDQLDEDELVDDRDTPKIAIENKLIYVLDIATIQEVGVK